ncbi:uncharacterized protein LOC114296365 isoform X5 [Camellia sinensis]|uniref:uncharacterized protein LOC114296365 isoform X5 n=1 Tax=Camellia sinensis TaxID=4442 RepID=UPI001035AD37|nr:uncharacterized protein LOC114296365 isoform X5 [Camellia sinensis]
MALLFPSFSLLGIPPSSGKWKSYRLIDYRDKRGRFRANSNSCVALCASSSSSMSVSKKLVWIWTQNKHVMTAAVERGWNTFVFPSHCRDLANEWSAMALIHPLFIEKGELLDSEHKRVATFSEISSPDQLEQLQPEDEQAENIIVNLLDWQVIPAENIVAAFQSSQKTVFAISRTPAEAQIFLEVGSFARGLFLVHSECLESNYISSRPFRVNAGPVHAYVAVPGGKTSYLSELKAGKEVIVVDQSGRQRTAVVGRVKIETRPLILVEAKRDSDTHTAYSILLQNAETVALICSHRENGNPTTAIPVTSLKVGDEVLLRIQSGARHTGIEIQEFIVEK